nr:Chain E, Peptide [synthetic construct]3FON_P Chain P, Peptide [synthetic construct]
VNDIFEAI